MFFIPMYSVLNVYQETLFYTFFLPQVQSSEASSVSLSYVKTFWNLPPGKKRKSLNWFMQISFL